MGHKRKAEDVADDEPYLQIGEVAERTGVTQRTLRFYEEKGLLKPPTRMEGGFRLYSEADIRRLERIRHLQQLLGFPLAEIKEMVDADEVKMQIRAEYRQDAEASEKKAQIQKAIEVTERQYELITQKADAIADMKAKLEERLNTYRGWIKQLDEAATDASKTRAGVSS